MISELVLLVILKGKKANVQDSQIAYVVAILIPLSSKTSASSMRMGACQKNAQGNIQQSRIGMSTKVGVSFIFGIV